MMPMSPSLQDELLRRLSEELRGSRGRSSSLMEELTRLEVLAGGEEYNRPLSPLDIITGVSMCIGEKSWCPVLTEQVLVVSKFHLFSLLF